MLLNQVTCWSSHVLAWLFYSLSSHWTHGEEAGLLRILPFFVAILSVGPFLAAAFWAYAVSPSYETSKGSNNEAKMYEDSSDKEDDTPVMDRKWVFVFWQVSTVVTRLTSLALLGFVYLDHWIEVGAPGWFRPALFLYTLPYLILLLFSNVGLHLGCLGAKSGLGRAFLSCLLPNGFKGAGMGKAGRYVVLNVSLNLALHLTTWLTMTFYCWECTKTLDLYFRKLSICFPVSVGFWMFSLVLTLITWRLSIRDSLDGSGEDYDKQETGDAKKSEEEEHRTAWSAKESSITTKF